MKIIVLFFFPLLLLIGSMACKTDDGMVPVQADTENNNVNDTMSNRLRIRLGSSIFSATLLNNSTVTAFKARLPMTVLMSELNGNEKLYNFPTNPSAGPLPTSSSNPGTINTGDLMLYGSNTLVLFYKSFSTSYSYTKLGRVDNPTGLAAALGSGNVTVTFELE